ncbi:hypothetical protein LYZ90_11385, partial [Xanthomonas hortorum pv. vitians]|uniref:hypothetical protein n=1 Tax=Xanthomonas hortorum TaxID=56454 RepID=UPI001F29580F
EDLPASLLALAQALSVTERQLHGSLLNMGVVSLICGALFRGSLMVSPSGSMKSSRRISPGWMARSLLLGRMATPQW